MKKKVLLQSLALYFFTCLMQVVINAYIMKIYTQTIQEEGLKIRMVAISLHCCFDWIYENGKVI